jgi:signal transduction histidine kinase
MIENNVLRLGQEAITNAVNHAQARHITVTMDFGEKAFLLTVVDDGIGFDPSNPPPSEGGFGLVGMQDRAKDSKGILAIRSDPNQGTEIRLKIPLQGE